MITLKAELAEAIEERLAAKMAHPVRASLVPTLREWAMLVGTALFTWAVVGG